jgi:hypothetical protein
MQSYAALICSNDIDGSVLSNCSSEDLSEIMKALGMSPYDRRFVLLSIQEWRQRPVCRPPAIHFCTHTARIHI